MTNHQRDNEAASAARRMEDMYHEFLQLFYEDDNRKEAERVARLLEKAYHDYPQFNESIRSEEIRSLIAELRGDFAAAIHSREAEIRKIFELHSMSINTPHWKDMLSIYGFGDISDRLDLLGLLYDQHGELDRAIAVLEESKHFCKAHKIPFDGQDILDELQENREKRRRQKARRASRNGKKAPVATKRRAASRTARQ